ncbi:MAG: dihydropyrimidinase [Actinomycetota bacterium]
MLLIRGGLAIGPDGAEPRDVLIDGETIAAVDEGIVPPAGADVVDAGGTYVIPGGIDPHTHLDLPVGAVRSADDFASGTVAAACGGTTCVVDFAGAGRESPEEALQTWHEKAGGRATIDYGFHLTVTSVPEAPDHALALFRSFIEAGVTSVKLYLAYPDRLMVDAATLGRALRAAPETGVLVCVHAEDGLEAERRTAAVLARGETSPAGHPRARPAEVEAAAIRTAADLAGAADAAVYVVHLSSAAGLAEVRAARDRGVAVLAETCPQYLFLTDEALRGAPDDAIDFMCTPPLRTDADRDALWGALADGGLQAVSTDHCPFTRADRRRGTGGEGVENFTQVPGGLPGLETRVPLLYQGVRDGRLSLERWVELIAAAPARLFGLSHRKGSLEPGLDADVVLFDPEAQHSLDASALHMRTDHSPYARRRIRGWPAVTISRGTIVARDGEPVEGEAGRGRYVPRRTFHA